MTTFYRLLGFLRPYKRGLPSPWALASLAMVMTVLIPYLTGLAPSKRSSAARTTRNTTSWSCARTTATRCSCSRW